MVATPTKFPLAYTPANTPLKGPHQYHSLNRHTPDDPFAIDAPSLLPQPNKSKAARPNFARRASHDLFECIEQSKHKRFDEKDAKYVFAQVVEVVEYLDSLGISHCDLKDENVVIDINLKVRYWLCSAIYILKYWISDKNNRLRKRCFLRSQGATAILSSILWNCSIRFAGDHRREALPGSTCRNLGTWRPPFLPCHRAISLPQ